MRKQKRVLGVLPKKMFEPRDYPFWGTVGGAMVGGLPTAIVGGMGGYVVYSRTKKKRSYTKKRGKRK